MKLAIRKKYFDQIKAGAKRFDLRDAHITFVCEETGETLRKTVDCVKMFTLGSDSCWEFFKLTPQEGAELFEGKKLMCFNLKEE